MERWPHGYRPTAGDLAHARFLQTAWYQLMRNGRSADQRVLPSGTYLIRLESGAGVETRKILMVR